MSEIKLEITAAGGVRMLHNDAVDLSELGEIRVKRASHVEYSCGRPCCDTERGWYVRSVKTKVFLKAGFETRAEALAWEKQHYSPGGEGWKELTEGG